MADASNQGVPEDKRSQDSSTIALGDLLLANGRGAAPAFPGRAVASVGTDLVAAQDEKQ
jgi:hypothetical protein